MEKIQSSYQQRYSLSNNCLVAHYLMHSYLYYGLDDPAISDSEYDDICKRLLYVYDELEHRHLHLVDKENLQCGSGYGISIPRIARDSAVLWKYNNITSSTKYIFEN